jgi:hypothetical protein
MSGLRERPMAAAFVRRSFLRLVEVAVEKGASLFALRERNK